VQTKGGLTVNSWSVTFGNLSETGLDKTKFYYYFNITNENKKETFIKSIQLFGNDTMKNMITPKERIIGVNKYIKFNETMEIQGEIIVDTKGLTKADIEKSQLVIKDIKISTK